MNVCTRRERERERERERADGMVFFVQGMIFLVKFQKFKVGANKIFLDRHI